MRRILLTVLGLLLWTGAARAATIYIRDGASGSGASWSDALDDIPASLGRNLYWIAEGNYTAREVMVAESGTNQVYFKKATADEHGDSTGWVNSYGDGQAVFSGIWGARCSYITWDGTTNYGFKSTVANVSSQAYEIPDSSARSNLSWKQIAVYGPAPDDFEWVFGPGVYPRGIRTLQNAYDFHRNWYFGYCYFNGLVDCIIVSYVHDAVVEHCRFHMNYGWEFTGGPEPARPHVNQIWADHADNWVIRYNLFSEHCTYACTLPGFTNGKCYGNVDYMTRREASCTFWLAGLTTCGINWGVNSGNVFYNNTSINVEWGLRSGGNVSDPNASNFYTNNIHYGWGDNFGELPGKVVADYNWYGAGSANDGGANSIYTVGVDPFMDAANHDYRIVETIGASYPRNKGATLAAEYSIDLLGNERGGIDGIWDIGAYEQGGSAPEDPLLQVTPSGATFGIILTNTPATNTFTVRNVGVGTLTGECTEENSEVAVYNGAYELTAGQSQTVTVVYTPTAVGSNQTTLSFSALGYDPQTRVVSGAGYPALGDLTWNALEGLVLSPFGDQGDGSIAQVAHSYDPTAGGAAVFGFTIATPGQYYVVASVDAPNGNQNSLFVQVDAEPTSFCWWEIPVTTGQETRGVGWVGSGEYDDPDFPTNYWTLSAGAHRLIVRGRELGTKLYSLQVVSGEQTVTAPTITTDLPASRTWVYGTWTNLTVAVSGTPPFHSFWYQDSVFDSVLSNLLVKPVQVTAASAGDWSCVVSNSAGTATSGVCVVTLAYPAVIASETWPQYRQVAEGGTTTFGLTAAGDAPLYYQWYSSGGSIAGATTNSYTLSGATTNDNYFCTVTNEYGSDLSSVWYVSVVGSEEAPGLTVTPASTNLNAGGSVRLMGFLTGTEPITLQWKKGGAILSGKTTYRLDLEKLAVADSGTYTLWVTNTAGYASDSCEVTVSAAPPATLGTLRISKP